MGEVYDVLDWSCSKPRNEIVLSRIQAMQNIFKPNQQRYITKLTSVSLMGIVLSSHSATKADEDQKVFEELSAQSTVLLQPLLSMVVNGLLAPHLREHNTLMTATIELRFILWYFFILDLVALQQSPPWPQPVKSLVVAGYILPKPPWLAFDPGNLFRIHYSCSTRSASLQYTLQFSPDAGNIKNQCLDLCLVNLITGSALNVMVQQLLVSVGSPSNALVLKIPIQGVVDAVHRKTLQGTGLNEEQMRQASAADNGHRQLNKILVDLDQDNITAKNYSIAFYIEKHIQIPCLGGEHEVTFFHEYRDSVEWVFVDHPLIIPRITDLEIYMELKLFFLGSNIIRSCLVPL